MKARRAAARERRRWLELSVAADIEAVEAVAEILGRSAPAGTSVEPAFELTDEGLGARVDPTRPAIVRAYLPAGDGVAAARLAAEASEALGHLQAFGLRPIGELTTRLVHEADWAEAWKAHFPVLRVGRRLVIRPTWRRHRRSPDDVVLALDPGMAFGTGLHPTTRLCLAGVESLADRGALDGARVLDVGCGSGILAIAAVKLGALEALGLDTDPIAVDATAANAARNRLARRIDARAGSLPSGERPLRRRAGQPHRQRPRRSEPASPRRGQAGRCRPRLRDLHRPRVRGAGWRSPTSGSTLPLGRRKGSGSPSRRFDAEGPRDGGGARPPTIEAMPAFFPVLLATHIVLAVSLFLPSILLPFALRTRRAAAESPNRFVRFLLWMQAHGTVVIGLGLAATGIGLVSVLGASLLQQPWLLVALAIYATNLVLAFFIQRPNLRRLIGIRAAPDDRVWLARARRQRYVSYAMAALVGTIGFLMSTKPKLW